MTLPATSDSLPHLDQDPGAITTVIIFGLLAIGLAFVAYSLMTDISAAGDKAVTWLPYALLGAALLMALGFEFVNGFHDTANAVATVIYTHSLPANFAVLWSGAFNFLGVLVSNGAVAFGIISLLPAELILQVGSNGNFAMIFALLTAAIIWNLGTWLLGLPASSSHTLIGSILGVGIANALMHGRDGASGVDWAQAAKVGYSLLFSPMIGFIGTALLLLAVRALVKNRELYAEPKGKLPPPWPIRCLLILTCTGVSFAHGSNDGQKGMGLILLILVGALPSAYALNRAMPADQIMQFVTLSQASQASLLKTGTTLSPADTRATLALYLRSKAYKPEVLPALANVIGGMGEQLQPYATFTELPMELTAALRNDMYLASETINFLGKNGAVKLDAGTQAQLLVIKQGIDHATQFIPLWVKVIVAIALGLGTLVGWKRIVVTVGEKIGKSHLTYAQGASAELVTMTTIGAAGMFGLPVSTTHILSSGIAGAMVANQSGLQWATIGNLLMAWVLTLPVAMLLSGSLYWLMATLF